jgi:two-component system cell cycle response regulator DivK
LLLAARNSYDLILLDINLSAAQNGIHVMRQMRAWAGYTEVPIVALTIQADLGDDVRFIQQGFDGHLAKPFTKDSLIDMVKYYLS